MKLTKNSMIAISVVLVGLALAAGLFAVNMNNRQTPASTASNPAQEAANPLKTALLNSGAVQKCEINSPVSADNRQPWYQVNFEVPQGRDKTIAMVQSAASANGYGLARAADNPGPVNATDVADWYYDVTSRTSGYNELKPGKVEVFFVVKNEPVTLGKAACGTNEDVKINGGAGTSYVRLEVKLPEAK